MSRKALILLGAALGLALGQSFPTNVTFERWTSPQGELVQLDGGGQTKRDYRVTALSRLDPNRPGFMLQPYNDQQTQVRTYDWRVTLNSKWETPVKITYNPTQAAYLKIDYTHSGLMDVWMYWDGQQIYGRYNGIEANPLWGFLWTGTSGLISLFWIPTGGGEFHTTLPIPLDGRVHVLQFGGGGNCFSLNGDWHAYYKVDSNRMQPGKIYWVQATNGCISPTPGITGSLTQKTNPVQVVYQTSGLPPLAPLGDPGWYDPRGVLGMLQWRWGRWPSLTGGMAEGNMTPSPATWQEIRVPPYPDLQAASTIPYYDPTWGQVTASRRYEVKSNPAAETDTFGNQLSQFTLSYCGGWDFIETNPNVNSGGYWVCTGETAQATYAVTRASPDPLYFDLNLDLYRPAFDGTVASKTVVGFDPQGRPVSSVVYEANPTIATQTYTVQETFTCISGSCP